MGQEWAQKCCLSKYSVGKIGKVPVCVCVCACVKELCGTAMCVEVVEAWYKNMVKCLCVKKCYVHKGCG